MFADTKLKRRLMVGIACAVLLINSIVLHSSLGSLVDAANWVRHSLDVKRELARIIVEISNAESGQRGYLLTDDIRYLDPHHAASSVIRAKLQALQTLVSDNPVQADQTQRLAELIDRKFNEMSETILLQNAGDKERAAELVKQNRGHAIMVEFRGLIEEMEAAENRLLAERQGVADIAHGAAYTALIAFVLATIMLLGLIYFLANSEIKRRSRASHELAALADRLHDQTADLKRERNEVALLNEASNFLQSCDTMAEISSLAGPFLQKLFEGCDGAVHITAASRNRLDRLTVWGQTEFSSHFGPQQCWGLRRGQPHLHVSGGLAPACDHAHMPDCDPTHLCIPLVAHGETVGLLTLVAVDGADGEVSVDRVQRLAEMVARQLGLTLANIHLRESLKEQTIRDPMTNMFNRRYLDVAAQKEIAKANRFGRPISVAMIDIDHFKRFNDTHGHQAGDAALVAVSHHIQAHIRDCDWLFRYGGEEFLLMLGDMDAEEAEIRLNALRESIAGLAISHDGTDLPQVTMSCGLASHPRHGDNIDELVAVADEALYAAKQAGRNRVVLAAIEVQRQALSA